jgi:ABC-type branched-subunit amino acid transport system substrate-binding protein
VDLRGGGAATEGRPYRYLSAVGGLGHAVANKNENVDQGEDMSSQATVKYPGAVALVAICVLLSFVGLAMAQDPLTPSETRGKQIYVHGTSQSGKEILAYVGQSSVEVSGRAMPCANCHGLDGQGKPEGGVTPSNLTWEALTKPYGVTHADGRQHPPYTDRGLELAISRGTDPAGNKLSDLMPRFVMSKQDMADLILYLKRVGKDRDPGITETEIVIGTTVPNGALAEMGHAVKAVTTAFFDDLNSHGGVYSRRFRLKLVETAETPEAKRAGVEGLLANDPVFAMIGPFIAGAEQEIIPLIAHYEVPMIGPVTLYPQIGFPLNRQVFYLLSGVDEQARALIDFIGKKPEFKSSGVAVVHPRSGIDAGVVKAIEDQGKKNGLSPAGDYPYTAGALGFRETLEQLRQSGRDVVFFLGASKELLSFLREADKANWYPTVLQPGSAATAELFNAPIAFDGKLFLSVPTSPADQSEKGTEEFYKFADKYNLPRHHLAAQFSAYGAAKILVEGLRRAGREVSREKLIEALEGLYEYQTGVTPPVTFGPNRRIGAMGAYVIGIGVKEKRLVPASGWIDIE